MVVTSWFLNLSPGFYDHLLQNRVRFQMVSISNTSIYLFKMFWVTPFINTYKHPLEKESFKVRRPIPPSWFPIEPCLLEGFTALEPWSPNSNCSAVPNTATLFTSSCHIGPQWYGWIPKWYLVANKMSTSMKKKDMSKQNPFPGLSKNRIAGISWTRKTTHNTLQAQEIHLQIPDVIWKLIVGFNGIKKHHHLESVNLLWGLSRLWQRFPKRSEISSHLSPVIRNLH